MFRVLTVFTLAACTAIVAGCGLRYSPSTAPVAATALRPLTADEQTRWVKFCRDHVQGYHAAGYLPDAGEWRFQHLTGWSRRVPLSGGNRGEPFESMNKDKATIWAMEEAANAKVALTVVVDLASMKVDAWYYDDGSGVKKFTTCPKPELGTKFQQFLHETQLFAHEN